MHGSAGSPTYVSHSYRYIICCSGMQYAVLEANVKVNRAYLRVVYGGYYNAVMLIRVHNDS